VNGISPLIRPASLILSKKAMRLIRPPKGVMGFAVEVCWTADLGRWNYKNFASFGEEGWCAAVRHNPFCCMNCSQFLFLCAIRYVCHFTTTTTPLDSVNRSPRSQQRSKNKKA
jgi:hypothetical protein